MKHLLLRTIAGTSLMLFGLSAGMQAQKLVNATRYVVPTWQICLRRVRRFGLLKHLVPNDVRSFADGLEIILDAYLSGDLTYTIITARSP